MTMIELNKSDSLLIQTCLNWFFIWCYCLLSLLAKWFAAHPFSIARTEAVPVLELMCVSICGRWKTRDWFLVLPKFLKRDKSRWYAFPHSHFLQYGHGGDSKLYSLSLREDKHILWGDWNVKQGLQRTNAVIIRIVCPFDEPANEDNYRGTRFIKPKMQRYSEQHCPLQTTHGILCWR
jgi:hypothetical protein